MKTLTNMMMKQKLFAMLAVVALLLGTVGCSKDDDRSAIDIKAEEDNLVGLWWNEIEYADVTEAGVPFSRVLLAVKVDADHTGCIYLGVFSDTGTEPLAVYGGPKDAGFKWRLQADGSMVFSDPDTGESVEITRADGSSYGQGMTDVANTNVTFFDGSMTVTNSVYTGTLAKADAEKKADIEEKLATLSPDRQQFEARLSQMLANSEQYVKLEPAMKGVKELTGFIRQLNFSALVGQMQSMVIDFMMKEHPFAYHDFNDPGMESARFALDNSDIQAKDATMFMEIIANIALKGSSIEFSGGGARYWNNRDDALTITSRNSNTVTRMRIKLGGDNDGVGIFVGLFNGIPLAIGFPRTSDVELYHSETGSDQDLELVLKGKLTTESVGGEKYISLTHSGWRSMLKTEAVKADHYELPACTFVHHADQVVETGADIAVNGNNVVSIISHTHANPYTEEELKQFSELENISPMWKGAYSLLQVFNSRSNKIELTLTDDLLFDIDVLDVGQCLKAAANVQKYRKQQPSKETIEPWTATLNKSVSFNMIQKSTGIKAEAKFVTSLFDGDHLPSVALRFKGENDFHVIHDRLNPTDRQRYEALLNSFNEPLNGINDLLKALQEQEEQMKAFAEAMGNIQM